MRTEVDRLLRQASADMTRADGNYRMGFYDTCAFYCHQAVEKTLKACYTHLRAEPYPKTHELHTIGMALGATREQSDWLKSLTPDYATARYPDAANGVPAEIYTEAMASQKLDTARKATAWLQTLI